jgi:hypothetical protein
MDAWIDKVSFLVLSRLLLIQKIAGCVRAINGLEKILLA